MPRVAIAFGIKQLCSLCSSLRVHRGVHTPLPSQSCVRADSLFFPPTHYLLLIERGLGVCMHNLGRVRSHYNGVIRRRCAPLRAWVMSHEEARNTVQYTAFTYHSQVTQVPFCTNRR